MEPVSAGLLEVIRGLELGIIDEEEEGFEGVEATLLGSVSGFDGAGKAVFILEEEFVRWARDATYIFQLVVDCVVAEDCERVHGWPKDVTG